MASNRLPKWSTDVSFTCAIDESSRKAIDDGLKRGELCLGISARVGDQEYSTDLYSDGMNTGELTFELEGDSLIRVKMKGTFEFDFSIEGSENEQIREARAPAICAYLSDPDGNFHDLEGDEELTVGELVVS